MSGNVWRVGDRADLRLPWGRSYFPVIIRGFVSGDMVHVEADPRVDDALVDNEWSISFSCLRERQ